MVWYKDWFNSEDYLKVYKHRDSKEAEILVNLIQKNSELQKGSKVLDMACGAGRHAIAFSRIGFEVIAVDLSERLIDVARKNLEQANVDIKFVRSDLRDLNLDIQFDLVVNLFTSFGYFETDDENLVVLKKAFEFLKDEGYFVLDYLNKTFLEKNLIPESKLMENGTSITQNRVIKGNRVEKKITIEKDDVITNFYESVRLYDYNELQEMLLLKGFKIKKLLGDFYGNKFDKNTSPRTIIIAQK